ncbi:hypothetical protein B620_gp15 [Croceibacter phage P2559S]|uniref:hypothetical protein n=1 Tax=Croceibacter phage P2559S TaxID=1176422 RepID=UPI0002688EAA|nr:hypothetical protein B620_gp15 [Croceibacter phage P2559S]AFM54793.1 hypothetical protein P2559S_15 [Croceibacter phage P2559S]
MLATREEFIKGCKMEKKYTSKKSTYWRATYQQEVYEFCVSNHHGDYRGKLYTFISLDRSEATARQFAADMRDYIIIEGAAYEFQKKSRQTKKSS